MRCKTKFIEVLKIITITYKTLFKRTSGNILTLRNLIEVLHLLFFDRAVLNYQLKINPSRNVSNVFPDLLFVSKGHVFFKDILTHFLIDVLLIM